RDVKNMEKTISVARAATITGFSANTIIRYTNEGQIRHEGELKRPYRLVESSVLEWAGKQKDKGGLFRPRTRKTHRGMPIEKGGKSHPGRHLVKNVRGRGDTDQRLERYLK